MVATKRPRVVFCRVGWMRFYGLWPEDDGPIGGGSFNEDDYGSELENFREFDGRYLGYMQAPGGATGVNLRRIDPSADREAETLEDVLVVLVARRPGEGGQVVVGWYAQATCHAALSHYRTRSYVWSADPHHAVLLPRSERTLLVPKGKGGMGQANVAYAYDADGSAHDGAWIDQVLESISGYTGPNLIAGAAYDELDDGSAHRAKKDREMLDHVVERGVRPLWRGAEILRAPAGGSYEVVARTAAGEERIIVRVTESNTRSVDLPATLLAEVARANVPYALLVVTGLSVRVRNGEFIFSGGTPHRESPFAPRPDRLEPVVLRYTFGAS